MGEINVQLTVINTHLFFGVLFSIQYLFIYSFISEKWYTFICETAFTSVNTSFVLLFLFYGVHKPFWFVILHRNIQHTKLLGGMCDTVKIISPNHHLFSPHMFDFIVNNSSLYHLKTLVKVI